jgi:hypothetical protein
MLKTAYNRGVQAAFTRYKIAIPLSSNGLGADYGVAPKGEEMSHGTERNTYPTKGGDNASVVDPQYNTTSKEHGKDYGSDFLWNISNYDDWAPGATGEYGQEVIG